MKYLPLVYGNPENWEHPLFLRDPRFLALPGKERDAPAAQAEELLAADRRPVRAAGAA
ncbi:hypothetical protein [Actinomadura geliboluensis]|uniref:hypothetical protein n=1 Tax=Actinomadura geliboluensis TaxID=882440 RepID=UPI0036CD312C